MPDPAAFERPRRIWLDLGLAGLLIVQVIVLVYLGLTPFQFFLRNQVAAQPEEGGIEFDAVGLATSEGSIDGRAHFANETISIHLMIEPSDEPRTGLGTIVSIDSATGPAPVIIAQWKKWLVVRVWDPAHRSLGYWEIDAAGFSKYVRRFVTITSGPLEGTAIYVDGIATGDTRQRSIIRNERGFEGRLLLGCLGNGSAGWRGTLSGLAIINERLTAEQVTWQHEQVQRAGFSALQEVRNLYALYDFSKLTQESGESLYSLSNAVSTSALGRLQFPQVFSPLRPEVFGIPQLRDMKADWFLDDMLRNIAGFTPFGFLASLLLIRSRNQPSYVITAQVALLGALLSLGIESIQIALPMRRSSLSDLSLNVIGSIIGALTAIAFRYTSLGRSTMRG